MSRHRRKTCFLVPLTWVTLLFLGIEPNLFPRGQSRLNDKDLETLMRNLKEDSRSFRSSFDAAIQKSTIRKTSRAKNATQLAVRFQSQTVAMFDEFKRKKTEPSQLASALDSAQQIDAVVYDLRLDGQTAAKWDKIKSELHEVAGGFNKVEHYRTESPAAPETACVQIIGVEGSQKLVQECLQVSPATHPPCNAQNSCALILEEIRRSCALIGKGAPDFCRPK